jgi:hypothetical protein
MKRRIETNDNTKGKPSFQEAAVTSKLILSKRSEK